MVYIKHLRCRSFSSEDLCFAAGQRVFLRCYWLLISQICTWLQDPCGVTILPQRPDHVNVNWGCFRFAKNKYSPNSHIKYNWLVKSHSVSEVSFFSFSTGATKRTLITSQIFSRRPCWNLQKHTIKWWKNAVYTCIFCKQMNSHGKHYTQVANNVNLWWLCSFSFVFSFGFAKWSQTRRLTAVSSGVGGGWAEKCANIDNKNNLAGREKRFLPQKH